jgi:hypothetical protein
MFRLLRWKQVEFSVVVNAAKFGVSAGTVNTREHNRSVAAKFLRPQNHQFLTGE